MRIIRPKAVSWLLLLGVLFPVAGCNDDHPIIPFPEPRIASPDDLVDAFLSALETRDIEALVPLFDHETEYFSFPFQEEDVTRLSLPAGGMAMEEMIQVWRNVFSGQDILNNEGEVVPGITGIEVIRFDRNTDWCGNECNPDSWLDLQYNIQKVVYRVKLTISRSGGNPPLLIEGNLEMNVRPPSSEDNYTEGYENYALFRIIDGTWDYDWEGMVTFGEFVYQYFTNEPPEVVLTLRAYQSDPLRVDGFACESQDAELFRWRTDPEGIWSDEDDDCSQGFVFEDFGEKMIEVEVFDRWGLSSRERITFELTPPEGTSPF